MANSKQIVYLSQAQYQELITNGTITVDGVTVTYDENDIYVTPQAGPVTDVRVNGTSVSSSGVANIPIASEQAYGAVKYSGSGYNGIMNMGGIISINPAYDTDLKAGNHGYKPVCPSRQHLAAFYGLAKAAGHDEKNSTESVGTYSPEAKGAIQSMLGVSALIATAENNLVASKAYAIGDVFTANGKLYKVTTAIAANDSIVLQNSGETVSGANAEEIKLSDYAVHDVQVNGTSVMQNGVANVPIATQNSPGAVKVGGYGVYMYNDNLRLEQPTENQQRQGTDGTKAVNLKIQHSAVFFGLAKAAGADMYSNGNAVVGQYPEAQKSAISEMLNGSVSVSGTTPTINALPGIRYVCGEVSTLDLTPPASGICDVVFTSGATATVLTVPSTIKWANGFDPTALETNTTYEINIMDGLGVAVGWT